MKDTLEQEKTRSSFQTTGHIGNHWTNVASSIDDGQLTLSMLHKTLEKAGKTVKLLDGSRKHIRLKGAMEEILMFQQQIQVCRDTLHLSLQTVVVLVVPMAFSDVRILTDRVGGIKSLSRNLQTKS